MRIPRARLSAGSRFIIRSGGVCERLKPAVLKKIKPPIRYLVENSTKSLCQLKDSDNSCFLSLLCLCSFCANFSDNLAALAPCNLSFNMSVTSSSPYFLCWNCAETGSLISKVQCCLWLVGEAYVSQGEEKL